MINRVRLVFSEDGSYDFQVVYCSKEKGIIKSIGDFFELCEKIAMDTSFKFCPGINADLYMSKYFSVIRYDPKSVRRTTHPISRIDSHKCLLWHQLSKNVSIFEKDMSEVLCSSCKRLRSDLEQSLKKKSCLAQNEKVKSCSHFPEKYLSPKSLKKKRQNINYERTNDKRLLKKYGDVDVTLNEDQHYQMCDIIEQINNTGSKSLDDIFVEGDKHGVRPALQAIWKNDQQNIKKEFHNDQRQNG